MGSVPTIVDVAKQAGGSVKTVSRVMNEYEHVSQKTRQKVDTAMRELGYVPNTAARDMRLGDSFTIGKRDGDPSSGYQSRLNHAVLKACTNRRRYLAVELFNEQDPGWVRQLQDFLDRTQVKNLILVPPMCDGVALHKLLRERGVKFALISPSRQVSSAPSIAMDDRLAALEMTQHLIDLGHKRIGHIAGHPDHVATLLRRQGFEEALSLAGLTPVDHSLIAEGDYNFRKAGEAAERMLRGPNPPTAIFAANDDMAAAVVMSANRLGMRVPEDLSVAGFDNTPISQTIWPSLTTIAQPFDQIAEMALTLLEQSGGPGQEIRSVVLPHELIIRESTTSPT